MESDAINACDSCGARPGIDVTYDPSGHYYVRGKMCPVVTEKESAVCDVDGWRKPRDMRDEALAALQKELTETRGERSGMWSECACLRRGWRR